MTKILGIDTGTNSLGWATVEHYENGEYALLEYGTHIFQEGVKIEKGIESSKAAERTEHRSQRKHYWRRKVRKIRLLAILIENHLCPPIGRSLLREWRLKNNIPRTRPSWHGNARITTETSILISFAINASPLNWT